MSRGFTTRRDVGEVRVRPFYARVLRLRHFEPSGMVCFLLLEGSIAAALILALAELLSWWGLIVLPVVVALVVKATDVLAVAATRSAHRVAQGERDRFQRANRPAVGRASVPVSPGPGGQGPPPGGQGPPPGGQGAAAGGRGRPGGDALGGPDLRGTVYASSVRSGQLDHGAGWGQHGREPDVNGAHPEWHVQRLEWHPQPPEWLRRPPGWRPEQQHGGSPGSADEQAPWPADERGWRDGQSGWPSSERGYG